MFTTKQHLTTARTLGVALVAALGLAGCKTYDTEFATINSRLDQLDTKVQGAAQSAEAAKEDAADDGDTAGRNRHRGRL